MGSRGSRDQRPELRVHARVRLELGGPAEDALRLPVPVEERRPHPDPPAAGPQRRRAGQSHRPDPHGHRQRTFRPREGARYIVTGVPVVTEGLADAVQRSIFVLLGAALLVMAATLALVFRSRLRLLPLALAGAAAAMTFGALSLAGGSLTMASIAVLPVLIGLAVDYAIQFQARFDEAVLAGSERPARGGRRGRGTDDRDRWPRNRRGLPRAAALARADGARLRPPPGGGDRARARLRALRGLRGARALLRPRAREPDAATRSAAGSRRHPRVHGGREWLADRSWRTLGVALSRPRRVLAVGLAVAVLGLVTRHPEQGRVGRARARAGGPPGAPAT